MLQRRKTCNDLKFRLSFSLSKLKGEANAYRFNNLCTNNESPAMETFSNMCYQIPGRLQNQNLQMRRAFSCNGFRTINIPRKPAGYRNMPACYGFTLVPHGYKKQGFKKQPCTRKRNPRLAYLRRFCTDTHKQSKTPVCKPAACNGSGFNSLRTGFNHNRSLHEHVSMGLFSRKTKSAIKLHTLTNLRGYIPEFIYITNGKVHDVNILDLLIPTPGAFYIMDRGYLDFRRLNNLHQQKAFFITRAKNNFKFKRRYSHIVKQSTGVQCDQTIVLTTFHPSKNYTDPLRRIRFYDI